MNVIFKPDYEEIPPTTLYYRDIQCFVWDAYCHGYHREVGEQTSGWSGPLKDVLGEDYTVWMKKITYVSTNRGMTVGVEVEVKRSLYLLQITY